jgi:hypothetical protein
LCKDYPQDIVNQIGDFDSDFKPEEILSEDSSISGTALLVNSILNSNFFRLIKVLMFCIKAMARSRHCICSYFDFGSDRTLYSINCRKQIKW